MCDKDETDWNCKNECFIKSTNDSKKLREKYKKRAIVITKISTFPKILVVCLNRFHSNGRKNNKVILVNQTLNLGKFSSKENDKQQYVLCFLFLLKH